MEKMSELVKRTWRKHSRTRMGGMIGMLVNGSLRQVTKCWCYTSNNYIKVESHAGGKDAVTYEIRN